MRSLISKICGLLLIVSGVAYAGPVPPPSVITVDSSTYVAGNSVMGTVGGVSNDGLAPLGSGVTGGFRMTTYRAEHINLRNNSGTEVGTVSNPLYTTATSTVTGTVTAVQPVGANLHVVVDTSALPSGAATAGNQATANASLSSIDGKITAVNTGNVTVATSALPAGASTGVKQDTGNSSLASIDGKIVTVNTSNIAGNVNAYVTNPTTSTVTGTVEVTQTTGSNLHMVMDSGSVDVISSALPTGAATETKQDTGNASLSSIDAKTPGLGQGAMAGSVPVAIASNQSSIPVTATITGTPTVDAYVTNPVTATVTGAVTANAGTNLNTSALALETGGNLATLAGGVSGSKYQVNLASVAGSAISTSNPVPTHDTGTVTINGSVTANAGTNLNTSLLALESGGNLATVAGAVSGAKMQENLAEVAGVTISAANPVPTHDTGTVTINGTITGTVTANAGTNLNTSALALESGGNLATLAGGVSGSKYQVNIASVMGSALSTSNPLPTHDTGTVTVAGNVGLNAGSNTIGKINFATPTTTAFSSTTINTTSTGDNTIVAGVSAQTVRVFRMFFVVSAATTITIKDGTGISLTGAMTFSSGGSYILDFDGDPWFVTSAANGFVINQSGTAQISGRIYWTQS